MCLSNHRLLLEEKHHVKSIRFPWVYKDRMELAVMNLINML